MNGAVALQIPKLIQRIFGALWPWSRNRSNILMNEPMQGVPRNRDLAIPILPERCEMPATPAPTSPQKMMHVKRRLRWTVNMLRTVSVSTFLFSHTKHLHSWQNAREWKVLPLFNYRTKAPKKTGVRPAFVSLTCE